MAASAPTSAPGSSKRSSTIISDREREVYLNLETKEERDRFMEAFWDRRDPNPATLEISCRIVANLQALGRHDEALQRVTALTRAAVAVLGPSQVDALRVREFHVTALLFADQIGRAHV